MKSFWELFYWSGRRRLIIITGSPLVACHVHQSRNSYVGMIMRLKFEGLKLYTLLYKVYRTHSFRFSPLYGKMEKFIVVVKFKSGNCGIIRQGCTGQRGLVSHAVQKPTTPSNGLIQRMHIMLNVKEILYIIIM